MKKILLIFALFISSIYSGEIDCEKEYFRPYDYIMWSVINDKKITLQERNYKANIARAIYLRYEICLKSKEKNIPSTEK